MGLADGNIGGPLPSPAALYPPNLAGVANVPANNRISLAPGDVLPIPRGSWMVNVGPYAQLQWLDPVTTIWRGITSARSRDERVISDGNNWRVANLTGCPVAAVVTNGGTAAYAQASTTVTPTTGNSTWLPIIGGQVSTAVTIVNGGAGYGVPPLCFVPAPPAPGAQASFIATLTAGAVTGVTCLNQGAGYPSAPPILFLPSPFDPNVIAGNAITPATGTLSLVAASGSASAGKLTALLCSNSGASATIPTLTIAGSGTGAAATAVMLLTATGVTITGAGTVIAANNEVTSVGGLSSASPAWTNPDIELTGFIPRKASMLMANAGSVVSAVSAIYDGGLFTGTPNCMFLQNGVAAGSSPNLSFILGGVNTTILMQPLG